MRLLLVVFTSLVALVGCSSPESAQPSPSAASPSASPSCTFDATVDGVTATSSAGALPTVSIGADATAPKKLVVEELCPGSGTQAAIGDAVAVNYAMAPYSTRQQLESSFERGRPLVLPLVKGTGTIEGFIEGIEGMQPGGVRLVLVPGAQAYGKTPPPGSPFGPNESFAFLLQLEEIASAPTAGPS